MSDPRAPGADLAVAGAAVLALGVALGVAWAAASGGYALGLSAPPTGATSSGAGMSVGYVAVYQK